MLPEFGNTQKIIRQFVGDAYVETLVNFVAFGDPYLTAKLLRQVQQSQRAKRGTRETKHDVLYGSFGVLNIGIQKS